MCNVCEHECIEMIGGRYPSCDADDSDPIGVFLMPPPTHEPCALIYLANYFSQHRKTLP
jgi:hypothetical protein